MPVTSQNKEKFEDYDGFVEKFKPKKTDGRLPEDWRLDHVRTDRQNE